MQYLVQPADARDDPFDITGTALTTDELAVPDPDIRPSRMRKSGLSPLFLLGREEIAIAAFVTAGNLLSLFYMSLPQNRCTVLRDMLRSRLSPAQSSNSCQPSFSTFSRSFSSFSSAG
jgi:hypothetical protein